MVVGRAVDAAGGQQDHVTHALERMFQGLYLHLFDVLCHGSLSAITVFVAAGFSLRWLSQFSYPQALAYSSGKSPQAQACGYTTTGIPGLMVAERVIDLM